MKLRPPTEADLTSEAIVQILDEARDAFPGSDFVDSVSDWFDAHGFITRQQADALRSIADRER